MKLIECRKCRYIHVMQIKFVIHDNIHWNIYLNIHKFKLKIMVEIKIEKHDSVKLYKIRKTLKELTSISGHGTELISVYIPKGKQLHEVITILKEEQGTADNIKSDLTRKRSGNVLWGASERRWWTTRKWNS